MTDDGDEIIEVPFNSEAWEREILQRPDVGRLGGDADSVLYTPGRLLVDGDAARDKRVREQLRRRKAERSTEDLGEVAKALGLVLFILPDDELVPAIRAIGAIAPAGASLDHIWLPGPNRIHGDDLPLPAGDPGDIPGADAAAGEGLSVTVLDTGIADAVGFDVDAGPADIELPDEDADKRRDHAAGHGTHVAGLIARTAAGAKLTARRLLRTPVGMATELETARALIDAGGAKTNLINCSFGGTTLFDGPALITERALATLSPATVVVAAAGNSGDTRPHWPAACKGVVAVGSVARRAKRGGDWLQTDFSNHGRWVDCCAPGVKLASTFLHWKGRPRADPTFKGFATWTGTSFSCPQVTGAIAALATRDQIEPQEAVYHLIHAPALARVGSVGTLVVP